MTHPGFKVSSTELTPYIGRLLKIITIDDDRIRVGFLSAIRDGQLILDDSEPISLSRIAAVYNIVSKKIAGEGPEEYVHG